MSSNLMDTAAGGEGDNYEDQIQTVTKPHKKSGGQLGESETAVDSDPSTQSAAHTERGEKTAENIRYGQAISEHGMGGQTTTSSGSAGQEDGSGDVGGGESSAEDTRVASGYGGEQDMDRSVGA